MDNRTPGSGYSYIYPPFYILPFHYATYSIVPQADRHFLLLFMIVSHSFKQMANFISISFLQIGTPFIYQFDSSSFFQFSVLFSLYVPFMTIFPTVYMISILLLLHATILTRAITCLFPSLPLSFPYIPPQLFPHFPH